MFSIVVFLRGPLAEKSQLEDIYSLFIATHMLLFMLAS